MDPPPVRFSALRRVNPRCIHTAMPKDIRKAHDILLNCIKGSGKQMTQVMRKDLLLLHADALTQPFHIFYRLLLFHLKSFSSIFPLSIFDGFIIANLVNGIKGFH